MVVTNFDAVARSYRWLEYLAFGRGLERARLAHLPTLADCRRILVIGDGDGRVVARLATTAPRAHIRAIDTSRRMLALAAVRLPPDARHRVTFEHDDVRSFDPGPEPWDAVVTMFVLDCFTTPEVGQISRRLVRGLAAGGSWLFVDFVVPPRGWRRRRARAWIGLLYRFFRWRTGLPIATLPESEQALEAAGLVPADVTVGQGGMLKSIRYVRPR